jgi:hypothetical protein
LSTLSLSAEKNCAQNSGAKRRDDINSLIMTSPVLERQPEVASWAVKASRPEGNGTNDCRVTMVVGLLCPLDPSDPVGLQMVSLGSQISGCGRVGFGRKGRADPDMRRAVSKN